MNTFRIVPDVTGTSLVELNGVDISNRLTGVSMVFLPGQLPRVRLELSPTAVEPIEGEGIIEVFRDMDDGQIVQSWLSHIDPAKLDSEVMRRTEWNDNAFALALTILKEWAGEHGN